MELNMGMNDGVRKNLSGLLHGVQYINQVKFTSQGLFDLTTAIGFSIEIQQRR
jgi:hypothetical protein